MQTFLESWGKAVALSAVVDDDCVAVPGAVTMALAATGNRFALVVYAALVRRVGAGEPVTLGALARDLRVPRRSREQLRRVVQFLFDLEMIPAIIAADAGVSVDGHEAVFPQ
ncbi:hypothetical protein [Glycomyces sp. YM15]|uniref:hypothetical protein n=1 Tax=Glycomyces sp. YM15 TaxID=2800446 RepID=UPI001964608E|nr:hypothetical protein [Glycomyces sp. YM15]